jgi:flavorubredoxin
LVVYESMYGNRAAVASAIADGLAASGVEVRAWPVTEVDATEVAEAGLLVIGGPTHAHGMTWATTRKTAASDKNSAPDGRAGTPGVDR